MYKENIQILKAKIHEMLLFFLNNSLPVCIQKKK